MDELLRDSIDPFAIPLQGLAAAAGYGDGLYQWTSQGWARFQPPIVPLSIVVRPGDAGDVADVERWDLTPADAPGFVRAFRRPRRAPTLYCNRVSWPQVTDALRAAGLDPAAVDWWIATLDGTLDVWYGAPGVAPPPGLRVVAVQVRGSAQTGGNYDESVILDPSWIGGPEVLDAEDPVITTLMQAIAAAGAQADAALAQAQDNRLVLGVLFNLLAYGDTHAPDGSPANVPDLPAIDKPALAALQQAVAQLPGGSVQLQPVLDAIAGVQASTTRIEDALKGA